MDQLILLSLMLNFAAKSSQLPPPAVSKIIEDVNRTNHPSHLALVHWKELSEGIGTWKFLCGATLITEKWVLTAAQCFYRKNSGVRRLNKDLALLLNAENSPNKKVSFLKLGAIEIHPNYNKTIWQENDIALAKLETPVKLSQAMQPARLPLQSDPLKFGSQVCAVSWAKNSLENLISEDMKIELQAACLNILKHPKCQSKQNTPIGPLICASSQRNREKGICSHDAGSGVFTQSQSGQSVLIGVFSTNLDECLNKGTTEPSILTNIAYLIDWIQSVTSTLSKKVVDECP